MAKKTPPAKQLIKLSSLRRISARPTSGIKLAPTEAQLSKTAPDSLPESTEHGPAPRTMQSGANPNSSVTDSRTTSAPSLISRAGTSAGLTRSAAASLPAGRRTEEEPPPPPTNIFQVWVRQRGGGALKHSPSWTQAGDCEKKAVKSTLTCGDASDIHVRAVCDL